MIHSEESKKSEKMEKISLDISSKGELSEALRGFPVLHDKSHEGFKEKDTLKNAWDGVEFVPNGNYYYLNWFLKSVSWKLCLIINLA